MTYNATKIADELTKTALGEAYYGNALYVALDFPFLTDEDKQVLHRYLHGANCGRDSHALQDIAIAIIEKAKEICVYPQSTGCRAQSTPISSQMMTMERMISERDDTIASMHRENVNLAAQRDELQKLLDKISKWDGGGIEVELATWRRVNSERDELLTAMKYLQEHRLWINSHAKAVIESAIAKVAP